MAFGTGDYSGNCEANLILVCIGPSTSTSLEAQQNLVTSLKNVSSYKQITS
jgi:hypothetical protein